MKVTVVAEFEVPDIKKGRRAKEDLASALYLMGYAARVTGPMKKTDDDTIPRVTIYTDGSCSRTKKHAGGWAYIVEWPHGEVIEAIGGEMPTTVGRMELTAVLRALQSLPDGMNVRVFTDSQYVSNGLSVFIRQWQRRGWQRADATEIANKDLWMALLDEKTRHTLVVSWVRGHNHHDQNERCDLLAGYARDAIYAGEANPSVPVTK